MTFAYCCYLVCRLSQVVRLFPLKNYIACSDAFSSHHSSKVYTATPKRYFSILKNTAQNISDILLHAIVVLCECNQVEEKLNLCTVTAAYMYKKLPYDTCGMICN